MTESDVRLPDGRAVRVHDAGGDGLAVVWHHGTPHTGELFAPLPALAAARGLRLVGYARPGYGGSTPLPGRDVASAAADVAQIADALGIGRFAVMGASGGGPHALACAALLGDRVVGAVTFASPCPYEGSETWFAGMVDDGPLRSALGGREARERFGASHEFDEHSFTAADWAALEGEWAGLAADAGRAGAGYPDGLVDDDVAFVSPWGIQLEQIAAPVLIVHGGEDRMVPATHGEQLARACRSSELRLQDDDGHVSVLHTAPLAMDWLAAA